MGMTLTLPKRYEKTSVLLLSWEVDHSDTESEVRYSGKLFESDRTIETDHLVAHAASLNAAVAVWLPGSVPARPSARECSSAGHQICG